LEKGCFQWLGIEIGKPGTHVNFANIRFDTWGFGGVWYATPNLKFVLYYDLVRNESTQAAGFTQDVKDNVFTFRMQFRF
jgi:phosphate-selective porin